jgi:hypothetical protein
LRRAAALAAVMAGAASAAAAALPAAASQAQPAARSQPGSQLSIEIDSVSPQYATPGATITVKGTVSNDSTVPVSDLSVQLYSSSQDFTTRSTMDSYMDPDGATSVVAEGTASAITATLRPGATAGWQAQFSAAAAGMGVAVGVYPLQAQVTDLDTGIVVATAKTLLPFWEGGTAQVRPLRTAWVWPLIDSPHRQACPALTDNSLAASFASGGRLAGLLAAGTQYPQADLTWLVDPALLGDAQTMRHQYSTGGNAADCAHASPQPASAAAGTWLSTVKSVTATQPAAITPYANADIAALEHRGMSASVAADYTLGESVAQGILNRTFGTSMAFPAGGKADLSTLTALATGEHVSGVVLGSGEMKYTNPADFADDAVAQLRTEAGTTMNVLLADDGLTELLTGASGATTQPEQFAVAQHYLAETAMIDAEAPEAQRSLVVDPPETWAPSQALAGKLLQETVNAPWLKPAALGTLAGSADSESTQPRQAPAATQVSPRELTKPYLHAVSGLDAMLAVYRSMLYQPPAGYTQELAEALAATESSAWRGGGRSAAAGAGLAEGLRQYVTRADGKVKFLTSPVRMGGSSGQLPVTVQNNLEEPIRVQVSASVLQDSPLKVSKPAEVIVDGGISRTVKLSVNSAPQGTSQISLHLTSHDGTVLPFADATISVQSTRYGRAILILIAAAIGVLVATSAIRAGRRWLRDGGGGSHSGTHGNQTGPSNVVISERHPTEAPDDLADARRWAEDTRSSATAFPPAFPGPEGPERPA